MDRYPCARNYGHQAGLGDLPHSSISVLFIFLSDVDFSPIFINKEWGQDEVFGDVHVRYTEGIDGCVSVVRLDGF
jgi:hypothetical protein